MWEDKWPSSEKTSKESKKEWRSTFVWPAKRTLCKSWSRCYWNWIRSIKGAYWDILKEDKSSSSRELSERPSNNRLLTKSWTSDPKGHPRKLVPTHLSLAFLRKMVAPVRGGREITARIATWQTMTGPTRRKLEPRPQSPFQKPRTTSTSGRHLRIRPSPSSPPIRGPRTSSRTPCQNWSAFLRRLRNRFRSRRVTRRLKRKSSSIRNKSRFWVAIAKDRSNLPITKYLDDEIVTIFVNKYR